MNLKINDEVKSILRTKGIPINEAIPFLICIYFGYDSKYIPEDIKRKIYACNIFTMDYSKPKELQLTWNVSLFEGQVVDSFDWIKEYMDMFKMVNPGRRGSRSYVIRRMKELFSTNPEIRKEDVFSATKKYLSEITDPTYVLQSHTFISNENGTPLLDRIKDMQKNNISSNNPTPFKKII